MKLKQNGFKTVSTPVADSEGADPALFPIVMLIIDRSTVKGDTQNVQNDSH